MYPKKLSTSKNTICIASGAKVFLLEDSEELMAWFGSRISNLYWAQTAPEGIAALAKFGPFEWIFLDHDLGILETQCGLEGTGEDVAEYLAENTYLSDAVVIHSWNRDAALRMQAWLPSAVVIPFGEFDIKEI